MNTLTRLMLCLAILAGGVMVGSKAGGGGGGAIPQNIFDAVTQQSDFYINQYAAQINVRDSNGDSPLHYAARIGNPTIVQLLLNLGAATYSVNNWNQAPEDVAANDYVRQQLGSTGLSSIGQSFGY